jgi:hypothetical protein
MGFNQAFKIFIFNIFFGIWQVFCGEIWFFSDIQKVFSKIGLFQTRQRKKSPLSENGEGVIFGRSVWRLLGEWNGAYEQEWASG